MKQETITLLQTRARLFEERAARQTDKAKQSKCIRIAVILRTAAEEIEKI